MRYMLSIYTDETRLAQASPDDIKWVMDAYGEFGREVEEAGVFVTGDGLQPTGTATTVRVRDGETLLTDGPFAETREQLGGFYVLDCQDIDEALRWAAKIPDAVHGSVEVRPVMDYEAMGAEEHRGADRARS
jgi:hypothetical protein